jgi:DNA-binding SARP family transcriptional activator
MEFCDVPLRIQLCGRLAIERGSAVVGEDAFPARQGRRLWAFLVLDRRQPMARGDVAAWIWQQGRRNESTCH